MKIMYVAHGHYWGSTWPYAYIDGYVTSALKQLGHEVKVFNCFNHAELVDPYVKAYMRQKQLPPEQLVPILDLMASQFLPFELLEFKPDLLVHIVGRLSDRVLKIVRDLKVKTAIWFLDDPQEIDKTAEMALLYDQVFTVESAALPAYRELGSKSVSFLPLGCDPAIQKSQPVEEKYRSDICFVGVAFPARVRFFDEMADFLKSYKVRIIGGGPLIGGGEADPWLWKRKLSRQDVYENAIIDEVIPPAEAAKYYNGAKINLNIHRAAVDDRFTQLNARGVGATAVSGRTFEIAGSGGFQLIDTVRTDYSRHFVPGQEIAVFQDAADFKKQVVYYLSHDQERQKIAAASQARAYRDHTYLARMKQLLSAVSA
jgi:spore maturation protein CgeB